MVITVDDYLPIKDDKNLKYADLGRDNSFWAPLMEKVWAKVMGSYENAQGGNGGLAMGFLLNTPTIEYEL